MTARPLASVLLTIALSAAPIQASSLAKRLDQLESEVSELRSILKRIDRRQASKSVTSSKTSQPSSGYRVRKGDSLWGIAKRHRTSVNKLKTANPGLNPRRLRIGMTINLPGKKTRSTSSSSSRIARSGSYIVRSGDTLGHIAKANGLRLTQLVSANPGINPDRISIGQKLALPGQPSKPATVAKTKVKAKPKTKPAPALTAKKPSPPKINPAANRPVAPPQVKQAANNIPERFPSPMKLVVIQKNSRLSEIAKKYRTSVNELNKLNEVSLSSNQMVKAGSQLYVPKG